MKYSARNDRVPFSGCPAKGGGKLAFFQDKNAHFMRVLGSKVSKSDCSENVNTIICIAKPKKAITAYREYLNILLKLIEAIERS